MLNSKISFKTVLFTIILSLAAIFSACGDDNPLNSFSDETGTSASMPPASIRIEPVWVGNVFEFKLINNSRDTIVNDFHVQFDPSVKITGWVSMLGWELDPNSTDTANGRIGVKKTPQGQPILPNGGVGIPVAVQLKFTGMTKTRGGDYDYTWQATRDGLVVRSGQDFFPRR